MNKIILLLVPTIALLALFCAAPQQARKWPPETGPALIPMPAEIAPHSGRFLLDASTTIMVQPLDRLQVVADYLSDMIYRGAGWRLSVGAGAQAEGKFISLQLIEPDGALGLEGYRLEITPQRVLIQAVQPAGIFYGIQTLRQLWPSQWEAESATFWSGPAEIPCLNISDQPRYRWRGMMLDVSRHFLPKEFVYHFIDYLAMNKMNTFHWHLVDDQGWRIEIQKYPKLTQVGAWRVDREAEHWNSRKPQLPGEKATYGGYYTQAEIRDIVAYAQSRFVTIVPEIEMPAHAQAALAAYPGYSCTGGPFTVLPGGVWPITNIYCAGKDGTFSFLQDVLDEVIDLFPGEYIHVGGDEADKTEWKKCINCQTRIHSEGLKDEAGLQSYFIRRIENFLTRKGKRLIGWDEILEGGLAQRATVMSWRGMDGGITAAREYHDVVMSPTDYCYFDYYQGPADLEPAAIGGHVPLETVYAFEPTPESLTPVQAAHIIGCQANLWTEFIPTPEHAQYMLFPRMLALAEVAWSPKATRNWPGFLNRLLALLPRLESMNINYARTIFNIRAIVESDQGGKNPRVVLSSPAENMEIRYTLDNSPPNLASPRYTRPIALASSATVMAGLFRNGALQGKIVTVPYMLHKAVSKKIAYIRQFSDRYPGAGPGALVDGLRGGNSHGDGAWQGFHQNSMEVVIDLGKKMPIRRVSSSYLQNVSSWIFGPREVTYSFSDKGRVYIMLARLPGNSDDKSSAIRILNFGQDFESLEARYIKVVASSIGLCPPGHSGAGDKAWLFADEIVVE